MIQKLKTFRQIWQNMGWRYIKYRTSFELRKRTGLLKRDFPTQVSDRVSLSFENWRNASPKFFFESREALIIKKSPTENLRQTFNQNSKGVFKFFSATEFDLGKNYDWLTNPDSNYRYPLKHWIEIPDYSQEIGDIKYVWEKSRFSYLYNIIRYDYHFQDDQAALVFDEIQSWINANPVNQGPNWRCSQEISLRVLNWIFALHYYKNSAHLTESIFQKIIQSIYWQMHHVYTNIDFSRIAVRNNHAITETLALYLTGLLYPTFPQANLWKIKGKQWFEEEITYQVYDDGTFLQFSMNYHRVLIQLFTWAFYLSEKNEEKFKDVVYEKAQKSLNFLMVCQDETSGQLPNYGANDGALFFPLSESHYRDYRPQLNALYYFFNKTVYNDGIEDLLWLGQKDIKIKEKVFRGSFSFTTGGYYIYKDDVSLSFIRCGNHKDRPSQADNLHFDLWYKGENILVDAGSYKYNTDSATLSQFIGTTAHNTISLSNNDQMFKGPRFIWFDWSQAVQASWQDSNDFVMFKGTIHAFKHLSKNIYHTRSIKIYKKNAIWEIEDEISDTLNALMIQNWHLPLKPTNQVDISSMTVAIETSGFYSSYYGRKEESRHIQFSQKSNIIKTKINIAV